MLEVGSKVKIVSEFYDVGWDGEKGVVSGREGVVVTLDTDRVDDTLFTVRVLVDPAMGAEELGFYAHELEVLDED